MPNHELQPDELRRMLERARSRTLRLVTDLDHAALIGPRLPIVNPPLWELGHIGWFQERWCLRRREGDSLAPSMLEGADALYDSSAVPHCKRWDLPLPSFDATLSYLGSVLARVCESITDNRSDIPYFVQLASLHEEMHAEAFTYSRHTLGYRSPDGNSVMQTGRGTSDFLGDAEIGGGEFMLGACPDDGFVFDNEKWAHVVRVRPFRIARSAVTNLEFAAFVEDRGYERPALWTKEGWSWRESAGALQPVYWKRSGEGWVERHFDELLPLDPQLPVMHVNWYEAEAYCRWAGRRLPTEAEWEYAAAASRDGGRSRFPWGAAAPDAERARLYGGGATRIPADALPAGDSASGVRQMIGNVWEWTADAFAPYPGFVADPYADYSQPWFGTHKVLRGGSLATCAALIRNTWRNFYTPDRRDIFAGFRTCAI